MQSEIFTIKLNTIIKIPVELIFPGDIVLLEEK